MSIILPDSLIQDIQKNNSGKILITNPVVMTVIAMLLASLSNSEMIKAQYDRSLGAQRQSNAGDKWSFFQAKHLCSSLERNSLNLLGAGVKHPPFDATHLAATTGLIALSVASHTYFFI